MVTVFTFILLNYFGYEYSGWLYVLPVLLDLTLIDLVAVISKSSKSSK